MAAWMRAGLLGLVLTAPVPALAADTLIDATNPEALADLFRGYGSARIDTAADGTPAIRGRIEGSMFSVYFYGCDDADKNCATINLTASWETKGSVTLEQVNDWNRNKRFGRAYIDAENNAVVETDINLAGGVSVPNMEANIDWWRIILGDFKTNVLEAGAPSDDAGGEQASAPASAGGEGEGGRRSVPFAIPRKPNN